MSSKVALSLLAVVVLGLAVAVIVAMLRPAEVPLENVRFQPLPQLVVGASETEPEPENGAEPGSVTLRVRFVDDAGRPVVGVAAAVRALGDVWRASSDLDGRISVEYEPERGSGDAELRYSRSGFANDLLGLTAKRGDTIDLGDVVLTPGGALSGRVVDESGEPLADVDLRVRGREIRTRSGLAHYQVDHDWLGASETETDARGEFRLSGLLAGEVRVLVDSDDDLYTAESGRIEIRAGMESVDLTLVVPRASDECIIEGVVLAPDGTPVSFGEVEARYGSRLGRSGMMTEQVRDGRFRIVVDFATDVDLTFTARRARWSAITRENVPTGTLDLVVQFEGDGE